MRVGDLFREWDDDNNGKVSKDEFTRGLKELGFEAKSDFEMFQSMEFDSKPEFDEFKRFRQFATKTEFDNFKMSDKYAEMTG